MMSDHTSRANAAVSTTDDEDGQSWELAADAFSAVCLGTYISDDCLVTFSLVDDSHVAFTLGQLRFTPSSQNVLLTRALDNLRRVIPPPADVVYWTRSWLNHHASGSRLSANRTRVSPSEVDELRTLLDALPHQPAPTTMDGAFPAAAFAQNTDEDDAEDGSPDADPRGMLKAGDGATPPRPVAATAIAAGSRRAAVTVRMPFVCPELFKLFASMIRGYACLTVRYVLDTEQRLIFTQMLTQLRISGDDFASVFHRGFADTDKLPAETVRTVIKSHRGETTHLAGRPSIDSSFALEADHDHDTRLPMMMGSHTGHCGTLQSERVSSRIVVGQLGGFLSSGVHSWSVACLHCEYVGVGVISRAVSACDREFFTTDGCAVRYMNGVLHTNFPSHQRRDCNVKFSKNSTVSLTIDFNQRLIIWYVDGQITELEPFDVSELAPAVVLKFNSVVRWWKSSLVPILG
jgi:hypothetical protein